VVPRAKSGSPSDAARQVITTVRTIKARPGTSGDPRTGLTGPRTISAPPDWPVVSEPYRVEGAFGSWPEPLITCLVSCGSS
jgi:hypothetical protein